MSLYLSAPGVERVRIHAYPKRRRQPRYPGLSAATSRPPFTASESMAGWDACYADFFRTEATATAVAS